MAKKHRRGRFNPVASLSRAVGKVFDKKDAKKAAGIIGGVIGTTFLTDIALSPDFMSTVRNNKFLNVLSMLGMSAVAGYLARQTKYTKAHANDIAIGGVVAGITRALKYVAKGSSWGKYLGEGDGMDGFDNYAHLDTPLVNLHGFGNYASPQSNLISMHGMGDDLNMRNAGFALSHPHLVGMGDSAVMGQIGQGPYAVHGAPYMAGMGYTPEADMMSGMGGIL